MPAAVRLVVRLRRLNKGAVTQRVCQVSETAEFTVDRHRVNGYYQLVGFELGGALELRPMCRVVLCSVAFVVLRVLDI